MSASRTASYQLAGVAVDARERPTVWASDGQEKGGAQTAAPDPHLPKGKIHKSVLTIGMPRRYRNKEHLRFVARQPCLLCGRKPSDPHHLRYVQPRALGRKPSDEFAIPLCRVHHREVHRAKDEKALWQQAGIDPLKVARKLWKHTRMDEGRIEPDALRRPGADPNQASSDGRAAGQRSVELTYCPPICLAPIAFYLTKGLRAAGGKYEGIQAGARTAMHQKKSPGFRRLAWPHE
jgi:hypothetical protein